MPIQNICNNQYKNADGCPMKVLILSSPEKMKTAEKIKVLCSSLGSDPLIYGDNTDCERGLFSCLDKNDLILIIWDDELLQKHEIAFSTGYCVGRRKPFILYRENKQGIPLCNGKAVVLLKEEELRAFIAEEVKKNKRQKNIKVAKSRILKMGLEIGIRDLIEAVSEGETIAVEQFLKAGFSSDSCDKNGVFLLNIAVRKGHINIASLLIDNGANINRVSGDRGNTPIMDAAAEGHIEILAKLINFGAELNLKSKSGQTALVLAVGSKDEDAALILIECGADIDIKDDLGMTVKKYAELFGLKRVLSLMDKGPK